MDQFPERPQDQLGKLVACRQGRGFGGATAGCAISGWSEAQLSESGRWVRNAIRARIRECRLKVELQSFGRGFRRRPAVARATRRSCLCFILPAVSVHKQFACFTCHREIASIIGAIHPNA